MSFTIEEFEKLVTPPDEAIGLDRSWESVEDEIGTRLPSDYKAFIDRYGSGILCGEIYVWNYRDISQFGQPLLNVLCGSGSVIEGYSEVEVNEHWPYFPEAGGLLPFASIVDVHNLNWATKGEPDSWDTVYWFSDGHEFIHFRGDPFSVALQKLLKNKYGKERFPTFSPPFEFAIQN